MVRSQGGGEARRRSTYVESSLWVSGGSHGGPPSASAQFLGSPAAYCCSPSTKNWRRAKRKHDPVNVKAKDDDKRLRAIFVAQNGEDVELRRFDGMIRY